MKYKNVDVEILPKNAELKYFYVSEESTLVPYKCRAGEVYMRQWVILMNTKLEKNVVIS